jgi:hypothetical protein
VLLLSFLFFLFPSLLFWGVPFWEVNFLDLNLKWSSVDNYILVAAGFLAAAASINDVSAAFVVLAVGMILKTTASAIYPDSSSRSATQKI